MNRLTALCMSVAIAACSDATLRLPSTSPGVRIYTMDCGSLEFADVGSCADDGSMNGVPRTFVDPCYLIRHPHGDLLWDTGLPEAIADTPGGTWPEGDSMHLVVARKLTAQLAELGLRPEDVRYLSLSHMHFDHSGNANLFAAANWIVDERERAAMFSDKARSYTSEFDHYSALETATTLLLKANDSHDVFGDGTVVIHPAPGHTPGHTVLLVRTGHSGPVLLTGDLWHLSESRERRLVPSFNVDRQQTLASMTAVEALANATGARIVRQHVREDFTALPAFPAPLP